MHGDDAGRARLAGAARPDKNGIAGLQQAYSQTKRYKRYLPWISTSLETISNGGRVKARQRTLPIPPSTAEKLGQPAEKVDDAKVQLKNALPETLQLGALRRPLSPTRIQGQMIR